MKRMPKSVVSLTAVAVATGVTALVYQFAIAADNPLPAPKFNIQNTPVAREGRVTSFAPVIKKAAPSVVNIYSTRVFRVQPYNDPSRWPGGDDNSRSRRPRTFMEQGLGSGVIVSSDGYILTASHVVEDADEVKVALADGQKKLDVKVVGSDPATDIAVLKVDAKNLPAMTLADSDKVEVGDVVLAIGNPFEVGQTVTMGIVSGLGRQSLGINKYENFIQTDAAINVGNSGGALADADGRLIGINTAILSRSGGSQGVGFAVPINLARAIMDRIIKDGKVTRGYLGVNIQSLDADLAKEFKVGATSGALVADVMPGTPAEKAGVKERDVIVELNGSKVVDGRQFRLAVSELSPQSKVTLKVVRAGTERKLIATLAELPKDVAVEGRSGTRDNGAAANDTFHGVTVADLTPRLRREFRIPDRILGVVVTGVDTDSIAHQTGLEAGDVIIEINHQPVNSSADFSRLTRLSTNGRTFLRVWGRDEDGNPATRYLMIQNGGR